MRDSWVTSCLEKGIRREGHLKEEIKTLRARECFEEGIQTSKKRHLKEGLALEGERLEEGIRTFRREGLRSQRHVKEGIRTSKVGAPRGWNWEPEGKWSSRRKLGPSKTKAH